MGHPDVTPVCLSDSYEFCFYTALIMIAEKIILKTSSEAPAGESD